MRRKKEGEARRTEDFKKIRQEVDKKIKKVRKIRRRRDDAKEDMSRRMLEKNGKGEMEIRNIQCTKRLSTFPSRSGMSLTK